MQMDVQMDKGIVVMFEWINSQMDNLSGESLKVFMLMSSLIQTILCLAMIMFCTVAKHTKWFGLIQLYYKNTYCVLVFLDNSV